MKNSAYILASQLLNMFFPLLILPVLLNSSDRAEFGMLMLALTFQSYALVFFEYSFGVISPEQEAKAGVIKFIVSVIYYKLALLVVFVMLSLVFSWYFSSFLFLLNSLILMSNVFNSSLYFVLKHKEKYFFISNLVSRVFVLFVFIFLYMLNMLTINMFIASQGVVFLVVSIFFFVFFITKRENGSFSIDIVYIRDMIISGIKAFIASLITSLYNFSNMFYISMYYGLEGAAVFGLFERYARAGISILASLVSYLYLKNIRASAGIVYTTGIAAVSAIFIASVYWFSFEVDILQEYDNYLILVLFCAPLAVLAYGVQLFLFYKRQRQRDVLVASVMILFCHVILSNILGFFQVYDMSIMVPVIVEFISLIIYVYFYRFRK